MKKIVLYIAISLDGYIADLKGKVEWLNEYSSHKSIELNYQAFYNSIDTIIIGSKTYEQIINELSFGNWPYQNKKCYVLTTRKLKTDKNVIFVNQDLNLLIKNIKKDCSKNIWICGGKNVIQQLHNAALIDEYIIHIMPIILGNGIKLFDHNINSWKLELIQAKNYDSIVELQYKKIK